MRTIRAAIKMSLFVLLTLSIYGVWWISNPFVKRKKEWRRYIFGTWTKSFVFVSQMRVNVIGTPPKPPFFLVCNHLSYSDIGALRAAVRGVFVAKAEVKTWPLAGRICRDMGTIFIDRKNRRDIPRAGEEIVERLNEGDGVIVFPEGTSTKGEEVLPFNSSFLQFAAVSNIPVSYASISYQTPASELPASLTACWWEDIGFFSHMWRMFRQVELTAIVTFGDAPIANSDRKLLAAELRDRVADIFVPVL